MPQPGLRGGAYRAMSLRAFKLATRQWSIWWLAGRQPQQIEVPRVGGFGGGVGPQSTGDSGPARLNCGAAGRSVNRSPCPAPAKSSAA